MGFSALELYALIFGLFLGLSLLKFGNPVILDRVIPAPATVHDLWVEAWPDRWAYGALLVFMGIGAVLANRLKWRWAAWPGLWFLPMLWFGWQWVSATRTVDGHLTADALWEFGGCVGCYFTGALLFGSRQVARFLWIGLLAAFTVCVVRAIHQRVFDFPREQRLFLEGERTGWTNFTPELVARLKRDQVIIHMDGKDVANPFIMAKYAKRRVHGTLVYPNALAGAVLLLWPVSIALAFSGTRRFRTGTRALVIAATLGLGGAAFFWTGSKLAWLIAVGMLCACLARVNCPARWKALMLGAVIVAGGTVFAVRFHNYFATGATSAGARLDYWRAAVQTAAHHPVTGSGPGTFQRPYARLKSPEAEMARLAHNDFLEQFSDSGVVGGASFLAWIVCALFVAARAGWKSPDPFGFAVVLGLTGWFVQGLGEFSLYIPGLAWPAFTLLGGAIVAEMQTRPASNQIDKSSPPN